MPYIFGAVSNSPVMSLSPRVSISPMFCKPSLFSPVSLALPTSNPSTPSSKSTSSSPLSPLTFRLHKQVNGGYNNRDCEKEEPTCWTSSPMPALIKRKRPPRLDVPVVSSLTFDMAAKTLAPVDRMNEVEVEGEGYSVYCKRGKKGTTEDRYSAFVEPESNEAFFGVFDGHGGAKAAEFAANILGRNIVDEVARRCDGRMEEAVKEGYLTTDAEFLKEDRSGGTCCVTALIRQGNLVVSNAGDCRAVLSRGGVAEALTIDHRPSRADERERIQSSGGYVDYCRGVWRVQGSLAVSRGLGDRHLKQWVIADPETRILDVTPECEFLVLASDGLWDKVSNQEAVDVVRTLCINIDHPKPVSACKKLTDLSITRGSTDDISVMVIQLGQFTSYTQKKESI